MPNKIESLTNLEFLPRDRNPVAQSSCYVCTICAQMMVCRFSSLLIGDPEVEIIQRFIMTVNSGEVVQFPVFQEEDCPFCLQMGYVQKERVKSVVPCSSTNKESTILPAKITDVWSKIRYWKFEDIAPSIIAKTEWTDGAAGRVDSTVKLSYTNGSTWYYRVTELSERNHTLAYELVAAEPATTVSSIVGEFSLRAVTDSD